MRVPESSYQSRGPYVLTTGAILVLFIAYAIQLNSPLRLNTDACEILKLTAKLTDGQPYLTNGTRPIFPIGIPLTFSFMERAGIASPFGFGLLNLICILITACAAWTICKALKMNELTRLAIILISLSNFVLIKHSVIPLTDIPYLMVSLLAIALLEVFLEQRPGRQLITFIFAVLSVGGAILARRIGIALIPAVLYTLWQWWCRKEGRQCAFSYRRIFLAGRGLLMLACALGLAAIVTGTMFRRIVYVPDLRFGDSIFAAVVKQIKMRLTDFGELTINMPTARLGKYYPVIFVAGILLAALIALGLWRARRDLHPTHIYLIFYIAVLAIWPYGDARFWIPVLPIIAILVVQAIAPSTHPRVSSCLVPIYLALYGIAACGALAYTTRISFAGNRFPEVYGDGSLRARYERAWEGQLNVPSNDEIVNLMRRYGKPSAP